MYETLSIYQCLTVVNNRAKTAYICFFGASPLSLLCFSLVMPAPSSALPTPPASSLDFLDERPKMPSQHVEEILPPVNPIDYEAESTQDPGSSIDGRRRRPLRRLLESLGKAYTAVVSNTALRMFERHQFSHASSYGGKSLVDHDIGGFLEISTS